MRCQYDRLGRESMDLSRRSSGEAACEHETYTPFRIWKSVGRRYWLSTPVWIKSSTSERTFSDQSSSIEALYIESIGGDEAFMTAVH